MSTIKEVSASNGELLKLKHSDYDPGMWIVEVLKKTLFGKKKTASYWFNSIEDAEHFILGYGKIKHAG